MQQLCRFPKILGTYGPLDIQVVDAQSVSFNERPTRFDLVTHQDGENFIGSTHTLPQLVIHHRIGWVFQQVHLDQVPRLPKQGAAIGAQVPER